MKLVFPLLLLLLLTTGCERPTETESGDTNIPPGVPSDLRIYYAADGEIIIDWLLSSHRDIKGYNIYRRTENTDYILTGFSTSDYFVDDSLSYDTLYFYTITAVNYSGMESGFSNEVSARPENRYRPLTPRTVLINARNWEGETSIYLSWERSDETDISGYLIFRGEETGFEPDSSNLIAFTDSSEYTDTKALIINKEYLYIIIAVDKGGLESDPSREVNDTILEEPLLISPTDNNTVADFSNFVFLSSGAPARYKVIVQSNMYFGEVWSEEISSEAIYDTVKVNVPYNIFYYNTYYYWRVAVFTKSSEPNSFSPLNKFKIKP
jgi:hypothetical protein